MFLGTLLLIIFSMTKVNIIFSISILLEMGNEEFLIDISFKKEKDLSLAEEGGGFKTETPGRYFKIYFSQLVWKIDFGFLGSKNPGGPL
jgi:hypothetical protein